VWRICNLNVMRIPIPVEVDLYRALGVAECADAAAIKRAWRQLASQHHPDRHQQRHSRDKKRGVGLSSSAPKSLSSIEHFLRAQEAYSILKDTQLRQAYDEGRREWLRRNEGKESLRETTAFSSSPDPRDASARARDNQRQLLPLTQQTTLWPIISSALSSVGHVLPFRHLVRVRILAAAVLLLLLMTSLHIWKLWNPALVDESLTSSSALAPGANHTDSKITIRPLTVRSPEYTSEHEEVAPAGSRLRRKKNRKAPKFAALPDESASPPRTSLRTKVASRTEGHTQQVLPLEPLAGNSRTAMLAPEPRSSTDDQNPAPEVAQLMNPVAAVPSLSGAVRAHSASLPDADRSTELGAWDRRWLAGCMVEDRVFVGELDLGPGESRFSWRAWDMESPGGVVLAAPLPPSSTRSTEVALHTRSFTLPQEGDPPGATLFRTAASAKLRWEQAAAMKIPCREWHLLSLESSAQLAGRWLLPDRKQSKPTSDGTTNAAFPLKHLELHIRSGKHHLQGQMVGLYDVGRSSIQLTVEFAFAARRRDFGGVFRWESASLGLGSLTITPISPSHLAIRWETEEPVPGKIQLTGGVALLRRR
jgi:hypothetical protein